jgi:hypothetical protein
MACIFFPSQLSSRWDEVSSLSNTVLRIILGRVSSSKRLAKSLVPKKILGFGLEGMAPKGGGGESERDMFATGTRNNKIMFLRLSVPHVIKSLFQFISWL